MINIMSSGATAFPMLRDLSWPMDVLARPRTARITGAHDVKTYAFVQGHPPRGLPPA